MILTIPRPEHVESILDMPIIVMYWPAIIGTALFFLALARGHTWLAIPIVAVAAGVQAMRLGISI